MFITSRWTAFVVAVGALIAAYIAQQEAARRRRQRKEALPPPVHQVSVSAPSVSAPLAPPTEANITSEPPPRPKARTSPTRGRRSSKRAAVATATTAAALFALLFGAREITGSEDPSPVIAAEAVDTEGGVRLAVRGQSFTPGSRVTLTWDGAGVGAEAIASDDGSMIAFLELPAAEGARELVVDDGSRSTRQVYAVGATPAGAVLGVGAGTKVSVNGSPYFLLGANYPWVNYGNDFGANAWGSYGVHSGGSYEADFADMAAKGVHVARWWVFADGRAGINFAADGTPLGVQPVVYEDLNRALALARKYNIYLDLVLFDVSMLGNANVVGGVQMGGHTDAFTDPTKRAALVNNVVKPLAQTYASDPMIVAWEIMNEPEWGISDLPHPAVNPDYTPITMAQFWAFASSASQIVHFYAQDQVTVGSAALKWHRVWTNDFAQSRGLPLLNLDFYQTHYYQWMDCCRTDDPVLGNTSWSPLVQPAYELGLDKPIVVGEIHTPSGEAGQQLDTLLANGYAGFWGWSYKYQNTGDKLQIDWPSFQQWETAHADIVRIPPPGAPPPAPTSTATAEPPTATNTTVTNTATPVPPAPTNTATKVASPTRTSTPPAPTPTPVNVPSGTISFDDLAQPNRALVGEYPSGEIAWDNGEWFLSGPWGGFTTNSVSLDSVKKSGDLRFVDAGRLMSLQAYNGGSTSATVKLTCGTNVPRSQTIQPGVIVTISTGWTVDCDSVRLWSSNGWHTNFDNLVYAGEGAAPSPEPPATNTATAPGQTATAAPSDTPTRTSTSVPATATRTSTPPPAPTATPSPVPTVQATPTPGGPLPACSGDCGNPRNFCDTWQGGFCTDYRQLGATTFEVPFPPPTELTTFDCLSSTAPGYLPGQLGGTLPFPCAFSKFEHFMTRMEDGSFGQALFRFHRPFDFAGRTGHVRFDIDLKGRTRNYVRLMLSPNLTKRGSDDRSGGSVYPEDFMELWLRGGVEGTICRAGSCVGDSYPFGDAFGSAYPPYYGVDNVRDSVDVYVSRTYLKVVYNQGKPNERVMVDQAIPDLGFDRAYVYLSQVSYNPCKDGYCAPQDQIFHWDNIAYDGPTLPANGLTPKGSRDVVFNAYSATSCTVKGVAADPVGPPQGYTWVTWRARLVDDGSSVSPTDVACNYSYSAEGSQQVRGFEVVKQP